MNNKYQYAFKFILVGDTGVGKTSIISRFIDGSFNNFHQFTVGVEYGHKIIAINGKRIKLQIWDTAGQQDFKSITRSYYRSSIAALVVFDITRKQTFKSVARWVEDIKNNSNKDVILVLVGNKIDLVQQRMISKNEALKLARQYEMLYIETSAKSQENIQRAFVWPANNVLDKIEGGFISLKREDESIKTGNIDLNRDKIDETCNCPC